MIHRARQDFASRAGLETAPVKILMEQRGAGHRNAPEN
jgi:hypothetical protein